MVKNDSVNKNVKKLINARAVLHFSSNVRFLGKRGENKWHVIIVRTVILMIVMMVGIAIKIVGVLSWIGIVCLIKIRKPFRRFWIEEETKLWNRFRKMNSGN